MQNLQTPLYQQQVIDTTMAELTVLLPMGRKPISGSSTVSARHFGGGREGVQRAGVSGSK